MIVNGFDDGYLNASLMFKCHDDKGCGAEWLVHYTMNQLIEVKEKKGF